MSVPYSFQKNADNQTISFVSKDRSKPPMNFSYRKPREILNEDFQIQKNEVVASIERFFNFSELKIVNSKFKVKHLQKNRFSMFLLNQNVDPFGDIKMLFTRNLHPPLPQVSNDDTFQQLIEDLQVSMKPELRKQKAEDLNLYLYQKALFNVYSHSRRFFVAAKESKLDKVPMSTTGPSPRQVFE